MGGYREFVVANQIPIAEQRYVLVIGASLGAAMNECLLTLKVMRGSNRGRRYIWVSYYGGKTGKC